MASIVSTGHEDLLMSSSYPRVLPKQNIISHVEDHSADSSVRAERTDNQLVDLVLAGDAGAFEEIFDRHKRLVAVVSSRYFRRPDEIEEMIQITFSKTFKDLGRFRGDHDRSFSSWLVRITTNACLDTLRSQKRKAERLTCELSDAETESLLELTAVDGSRAESQILDRDLIEKLLALIAPTDRAILQMLYAEEMSLADIAEVLGCTRANVKVKAWRARAAVRKALKTIL